MRMMIDDDVRKCYNPPMRWICEVCRTLPGVVEVKPKILMRPVKQDLIKIMFHQEVVFFDYICVSLLLQCEAMVKCPNLKLFCLKERLDSNPSFRGRASFCF